jgi:predicted dehydrogenase
MASIHNQLSEFLSLGLDVVHVTSSPWSHHEVAVAALDSGAHVFTEKPMAMNSVEAEDMARHALAADRLLCVSHNFLESVAMREACNRFGTTSVDYALGLQLSAETRRLPVWYRELPGGLMFDEVPHMMYSMMYLLGGGLTLDHARATLDESGHPRTIEALVKGRTGQGQITMVFCSPVSEWHIMASSPAAFVDIDLFRDITISLAPDGAHGSLDIARSSLSAVAGHVSGFVRAGSRWVRKRQYWGHDALIGKFLDAVHEGGPSPVAEEQCLGVVRITDDLLDAIGIKTVVRPSS